MAQQAPRKAYRKGMSLIEIMRLFPDDSTAEVWFVETRWPTGPHCPACGSKNVLVGAAHKTMPYRCREKECRKRFSVKTGSVMEASNIGYQKWAIAIYLALTSLKSVSSMKLHRDLTITQKSAWHLSHRIRVAFESGKGVFGGPVEADETYVGGKRRNMSNAKRRDLKDSGRGAVGKAAVVGVKDRATKQVRARHVRHTDTAHVAGFVAEHAKPVPVSTPTMLACTTRWSRGTSVNRLSTRLSEYVRGDVHTNGIEGFWSMFKRGCVGTFHKISEKHLQRYIDEFAGKHNVREQDTRDQMAGVVSAMVGKRLRYEDLIADNSLDSGARHDAEVQE